MRLLVVSHKECWLDSQGSWVTVGGFPRQMLAISALFSETRLMICRRRTKPPADAEELAGHRLTVEPLPEPRGHGARRKLGLLGWLPWHLRRLWRAVSQSDAVHALVPGDVGLIGLLIAFVQRKPLWVRHCGTWNNRTTAADRFLAWLLPRIAGDRTVVTATGGGETPPCPENPAVDWIFSTALWHDEITGLTPALLWRPDQALRLIQVGRLTAGKNAASSIRAMATVRQEIPRARLDILGDGPQMVSLRQLVTELDLTSSVTLHGNVARERVLEHLQRSHLFVFPTRVAEGFPKAVLEAMACGLPVLVPEVSVLPRLVADGGGRVLEDTDDETLARIVLALASNPDRLADMAKNAQHTAQQYSLEAWQQAIRRRLERSWGPLTAPLDAAVTTS